MKTTCKKSWPGNLSSDNISWILYTSYRTEVVPKIFPNLNVVAHLVVPAGWGSYLQKLAIFSFFFLSAFTVDAYVNPGQNFPMIIRQSLTQLSPHSAHMLKPQTTTEDVSDLIY